MQVTASWQSDSDSCCCQRPIVSINTATPITDSLSLIRNQSRCRRYCLCYQPECDLIRGKLDYVQQVATSTLLGIRQEPDHVTQGPISKRARSLWQVGCPFFRIGRPSPDFYNRADFHPIKMEALVFFSKSKIGPISDFQNHPRFRSHKSWFHAETTNCAYSRNSSRFLRRRSSTHTVNHH